jgi:hypothetical protein
MVLCTPPRLSTGSKLQFPKLSTQWLRPVKEELQMEETTEAMPYEVVPLAAMMEWAMVLAELARSE